MFCKHCGKALAPEAQFCSSCGRAQSDPVAPHSYGAASSTGPAPGIAPTSGKAIGSLICGLFFIILPAGLAAIILGHLALSEIKKSAGRIKGEGLAIAGLVLGYMGIAFIPIALIIAAIAIPNLLRARIAANEASAVSTIRVLVTAEISHQAAHPEDGFSCDFRQVVSEAGLDPDMAHGTLHGYVFRLSDCSSEGTGKNITKFHIVAYPAARNQTGRRAFCVDESAVIRFSPNGSAMQCLQNGDLLQ